MNDVFAEIDKRIEIFNELLNQRDAAYAVTVKVRGCRGKNSDLNLSTQQNAKDGTWSVRAGSMSDFIQWKALTDHDMSIKVAAVPYLKLVLDMIDQTVRDLEYAGTKAIKDFDDSIRYPITTVPNTPKGNLS